MVSPGVEPSSAAKVETELEGARDDWAGAEVVGGCPV